MMKNHLNFFLNLKVEQGNDEDITIKSYLLLITILSVRGKPYIGRFSSWELELK